MKKTRSARRMQKMLIMVAAIALVFGVAIGGTIAWLTDATTPVTNTFTVGEIEIKLDEAVLDNTGAATTTRTEEGNADIEIIPGDVVPKDPMVTVLANSESCYVFVTVENTLLLDDGTAVSTLNIDTTHWVKVRDLTATKALYVYSTNGADPAVVAESAQATELAKVFTTVTIANTVTKDQLPQLEDDYIVVNAYAIQSENLGEADTAAEIWALVPQA